MTEREERDVSDATAADQVAERLEDVERRLVQIERRTRHAFTAGCSRCYAVLAGVLVTLSLFPIIDDVTLVDQRYEYGSIWEMADGSAAMGAVGLVILAILLVGGAFRTVPPKTGGWDATIGALAVLLAVLLSTRPGTEVDPSLTAVGKLGVAILILTAVLALGHEAYATSSRRPPSGRWASPR